MLSFGKIVRVAQPLERIFSVNGMKVSAKQGITSKGVKWTKLYDTNGDLVSWKQAFNGKIKKGRYEKVDVFDWNKGVTSEISGNKKTTTVKFDGFEKEKYPAKTYSSFSSVDDSFNFMNKYEPAKTDDLFTNPWEKNPWDL